MGLDAVVYKRLEEVAIPQTIDLDLVRVDEYTGEVYLDNDMSGLTPEAVQATHRRLGNIALISALHDEVNKLLAGFSSESLILSKVLYDGTHCGDIIPRDQIDTLQREINLVRGIAGTGASPELQEFLSDMEELASASERHGNPIVF
jgi:hypothetical protein